jgi:hypothetical protein
MKWCTVDGPTVRALPSNHPGCLVPRPSKAGTDVKTGTNGGQTRRTEHDHGSIFKHSDSKNSVRGKQCVPFATQAFEARSQNWEKAILRHVCPYVRPRNNSAPTGRILMKFDIWPFFFFRKSVHTIQVSLKSDSNNGYVTWRRFHVYDNISLNYY